MLNKEHDITLDLILQAAEKIIDFLNGYDLSKFLTDPKTQSAVIMQIIVIGELSKKLSEEIKANINLPWREMAGFRDFAVHDYFILDLNKVWDTATQDVPTVLEKLRFYIKTKS